MRIGLVSYDFDPPIGGLGIVAKRYRDLIVRDSSMNVVVLSPSPGADECVARIARFWWKKPGGCPLFSLVLILRLNFLIRKHRLDMLHIHAGSGGVFLLRKPACPVVVTSHHTYFDEATLVFHRRRVKKIWKYFMSVLERKTYMLADTITCVSKDTADSLARSYGVPREKMSVIENPVSPPLDYPRAESSNSPPGGVEKEREERAILFVGRLEERKGIWTLLKAFKRLSETMPSAKLRLIGNNLLGDSLEEFLRKEKLQHRVELLGFVPDPARFSEMARASVIVVPSILEGFGLIAAEAMLLGTCVIASDAPGLRSMIEDGKTGRLFPVNNDRACADGIEELLRNPEKRKMYAEHAKREAERRFDPEERMNELLKIFFINSRSGGSLPPRFRKNHS